jgi:hypothetical protein
LKNDRLRFHCNYKTYDPVLLITSSTVLLTTLNFVRYNFKVTNKRIPKQMVTVTMEEQGKEKDHGKDGLMRLKRIMKIWE